MIVADASAAVAAFAGWHDRQEAAQRALGRSAGVVAHAAYEAYSVLTRLPNAQRAPAALVLEQLRDTFGDRWIGLSADAQRLALDRLATLGVSGGQTYDGLIAITAAAHDARLVTLDRRALATYALVGADVELVT
ncbi:MAG: PIN domain-containing protein [Thermoleophilia bacterium]|nr:PIN domain-containing protein [Thermoleophilia bacterium]MDH5334496.1 PIN domain-containing protein [Thermoleophilia bacterium]